MRIIIDIAHPAHIHYFRNFAKTMEKRGHEYLMTLREKDIIIKLADYYNLKYKIRSNSNKESLSKLDYALTSIKNLYYISKEFNPDIFIDMGTIFSAPIAKFLGVPHIAFDDTEVAYKARLLFMPFNSFILTPQCFRKNIGRKHIRFSGYMELFYLHDKQFKPEPKVLNDLNIKNYEKISVLRFISWQAHHDKGQKGFSENEKIELVKEISKSSRVFISSESESLNDELRPYLLNIHPAQMHSLLYYSDLYIGEGATMASECAVLGTPAIYFNSINAGTIDDQSDHGMVFHCKTYRAVLDKTKELLSKKNLKEEFLMRRQKLLVDKIDMTAFLTWFVEKFPESTRIMKENPNYQLNFR